MITQPLKTSEPSTGKVEGSETLKTSVSIVANDTPESKQKLSSFHPLHLADLRKSGLSDDTILQHEIKTVRPKDIDKLIGYNIPGLISAYRIPFLPFTDGYFRLKAFYTPGQERYADGRKKPRYIQAKR